MLNTRINVALRAYDQFSPLITGAASVPGYEFAVDFRAPLSDDFTPGFHAREVSFNRYVIAHARGDRRLVGVPAFVLRGFRHRNYMVKADSPLTRLSELDGKRIGTNSWGDTGTMWARAALREAGVDLENVEWTIGHLDEHVKMKVASSLDVSPPKTSKRLEESDTLLQALSRGALDAVTTALMPESVYDPAGEYRRLIPNYRDAELSYHSRTGIYPAFHIMAFERSFIERSPEAGRALYEALQASWELWWTKTKNFGDASPWATEEAETMLRRFPQDVFPFGTESPTHRNMLAAMCQEQKMQKMVETAADPNSLFAAFEQLVA